MDVHFLYSATAVVALQLFFLSPALCSSFLPDYRCGWCPRRAAASLFPPDADLAAGACGYVSTAREELLDAGYHIAAASAHLFRGGDGCGACYQLRCRDRSACGDDGVKVVVTDSDVVTANRTETGGRLRFLLTEDAFTAMAPKHADEDDRWFTAEVELRRIRCEYGNRNLAVRVEETSSRSRGHLAVSFLFQGGQTDIAAVEVAQVGAGPGASAMAPSWRYMTRRGGVWRTSRAPAGPLLLRLVVTAGSGGKWLRSDGEVLPADWRPGEVYDTGLRVTDVAARTCGSEFRLLRHGRG